MTRQDMRQTGRKRDMIRTQKARQETRLLSRARFPLGGREGGSPSGIVIVVERFPPYNEYSDE